MFKEVSDRYIILMGLMGLCPCLWYVWLATGTEEGRKMLGTCIGLAFFHLALALIFFCYLPVNWWIRKSNNRRNVDIEAQLDSEALVEGEGLVDGQGLVDSQCLVDGQGLVEVQCLVDGQALVDGQPLMDGQGLVDSQALVVDKDGED